MRGCLNNIHNYVKKVRNNSVTKNLLKSKLTKAGAHTLATEFGRAGLAGLINMDYPEKKGIMR